MVAPPLAAASVFPTLTRSLHGSRRHGINLVGGMAIDHRANPSRSEYECHRSDTLDSNLNSDSRSAILSTIIPAQSIDMQRQHDYQ
jgi:hypothetical protein